MDLNECVWKRMLNLDGLRLENHLFLNYDLWWLLMNLNGGRLNSLNLSGQSSLLIAFAFECLADLRGLLGFDVRAQLIQVVIKFGD